MQFVDLNAQQQRIKADILDNIQTVLAHGKYIMGPEVQELEKSLADYIGVKYGISCSSGTDALLLALMAIKIGPGDAVFTSPFTFIATAEVISILGATPIFVDIDPESFNIDPGKLEETIESVKKNSDLRAKAIIPVDLYGLPADYTMINRIAKVNNLTVIGDAAQSFGAEYNGEKACLLPDISCTSFFPAKPLGCYGDGGMCLTDNDDLAEAMRSLRLHGKGTHKYDNTRIGFNGRLDTMQAAVLMAKFSIFPEELELRQTVAANYSVLIANKAGADIRTPIVQKEYKSAWAQYSVLAPSETHRKVFQENLQKNDIPSIIYYPKPLHLQTAFSYLGYKEGDFPISEEMSARVFSLPMYPYLKTDQQEFIVNSL